MKALESGSKIYFLGIAGTGMAAVAGLMQEAGYDISGSDNDMYPPMSTMLNQLKIPVKTPYSPENLRNWNGQMIVVANSLSRGHLEMEYMLERGFAYTSFPALLGENILGSRTSIVVSGTHGKTTTTSLFAYVLEQLGEDPGFLVGGVPRNFPQSFRIGSGKPFVIEGDEYDTAWFDKESKFLHYRPKYVIFNNLEFDHADIFKDLTAIENMFKKLLNLVPNKKHIIANVDDKNVVRVCEQLGILDQVTQVSTTGLKNNANVTVQGLKVKSSGKDQIWSAQIKTATLGVLNIETHLSGVHNMANIAQVVACLETMQNSNDLKHKIDSVKLTKAISGFLGVKRRLDLLGSHNDVDVYEDFAHHPTAVGLVIESYKKAQPNRRLIVAFEPRNATARRNVFQREFAEKLSLADRVLIGKCPVDKRIAESERMNTDEIRHLIGEKAINFNENEELFEHLVKNCTPGDTVIFMSSGSFSGIQYKLAEQLIK